jgi:hypothetical protein
MILYGRIQERALDEAQRQIKPVVAVNKPPAVNSRRGGVSWDRCPARLHCAPTWRSAEREGRRFI